MQQNDQIDVLLHNHSTLIIKRQKATKFSECIHKATVKK